MGLTTAAAGNSPHKVPDVKADLLRGKKFQLSSLIPTTHFKLVPIVEQYIQLGGTTESAAVPVHIQEHWLGLSSLSVPDWTE